MTSCATSFAASNKASVSGEDSEPPALPTLGRNPGNHGCASARSRGRNPEPSSIKIVSAPRMLPPAAWAARSLIRNGPYCSFPRTTTNVAWARSSSSTSWYCVSPSSPVSTPTPAPPRPSSPSSDSATPQTESSAVGNHDCADARPIVRSVPPLHLHYQVIRSDATRGHEGRELARRVRSRPASTAHDPEERLS